MNSNTPSQSGDKTPSGGGGKMPMLIAGVAAVVALGVGGWLALSPGAAAEKPAQTSDKAEAKAKPAVKVAPKEPTFATLKERGQWLFNNKGCTACHGKDGVGGVANPGSIRGTVPALNKLAERLQIFEEEDADIVAKRLEAGKKLDAAEQPAPFRSWSRFVAQYEAVQGVIKNGNPAGRKVAGGPAPPLNMPAWGSQLNRRDVDAIIIWLVSKFPWDADDEDDEDEEE